MDYDKTPRGRWWQRAAIISGLALAALVIVCLVSLATNKSEYMAYRDVARNTPAGVPVMVIRDDGSIVEYRAPVLIDMRYIIGTVGALVAVVGVDIKRTRARRQLP